MGSPLNQSESTSHAPYYQPIQSIPFHNGQEYGHTTVANGSAYPDLPEGVVDETSREHHGGDQALQHHFDGSDQLEGLLRVAGSVAAQDPLDQASNGLASSQHHAPIQQGKNKRKHSSSPLEEHANHEPRRSKRQKQNALPFPTDTPTLHTHPQPTDENLTPRTTTTTAPTPSHTASTPYTSPLPPGIHTSAALFRRRPPTPPPNTSSSSTTGAISTTTTVRKSTRPPISKLFTSLELTPAAFLSLQAAAKAFMLDAAHPERQACVGNRGRGDSDVVKLRLYTCVRDFLEEEEEAEETMTRMMAEEDGGGGADGTGTTNAGEEVARGDDGNGGVSAIAGLGEGEGAPLTKRQQQSRGEAFFGPHVRRPDGGERRWVWPRDRERVIGLCVPLLRRMVTNERQRRYAVETRSQARSEGGGAAGVAGKPRDDVNGAVRGEEGEEQEVDLRGVVAGASAPIMYHVYVLDPVTGVLERPRIDIQDTALMDFEAVVARVRRVFGMSDDNDADAASLITEPIQPDASRTLQQDAQRALAVEKSVSTDLHEKGFAVHIQTPAGLKLVGGQEEWVTSVRDVLQSPWFENRVKVIIRTNQIT
ncbi:MAG: hypothetical protein M1821_007393 [Bathelium mastoideum]|nr:MAG: hypothetical protein M1821_007393 [Bathelium mastoideum]